MRLRAFLGVYWPFGYTIVECLLKSYSHFHLCDCDIYKGSKTKIDFSFKRLWSICI